MNAETVKHWLDQTKEWSSLSSGQITDVTAHRNELRTFLQALHHQLVQWGSPSVALRNIPSVGQLLGRLCCNQALMVQEDDYGLIMQCVLALYTTTPGSPVEEQAVKWVQSQIRHSISYHNEEDPCSRVGESVGCSASRYNQTQSLKLMESMVEDLYKVPITRWDSGANCLVPSSQLSNATLKHLSELCLPLVTSGTSDIVPLVECLLSCHGNGPQESLSPAFLEAIFETQQHAYTDNSSLKLNYAGRVSLWTRYLPALECEFLNLVQALVTEHPLSELGCRELIASRQLPLACAENPSLDAAIQSLMELLLQNTESSAFTLSLRETFSKCVQERRQTLTISQFRCRVTGMDSLGYQLKVNPQDLPISLLTLYINNISTCLLQIAPDDSAGHIRSWLLLVRSPGWHHAVIKMLLQGSTETRPACLNILAWYNLPLVPHRHQQYKAQLDDLVTSLRGLCSKTIIQTQDLHCAFNPLHGAAELKEGHMRNVIRPLLMLLIVYGNVTHELLDDIVKMASGDDVPNAATSYEFQLESLEFCLVGDSSSQRLGRRGKHIVQALQECKEAYVAEYQQQSRLGETVDLTEQQNVDLLRRYDRILKLVT